MARPTPYRADTPDVLGWPFWLPIICLLGALWMVFAHLFLEASP